MFRGVEVDDSPPPMVDHQGAVKHTGSPGGHRKEVQRRNRILVVRQNRQLWLTRISLAAELSPTTRNRWPQERAEIVSIIKE